MELDAALIEAFKGVARLRQSHRTAVYIKFPPLPSVFSESVVIAAAEALFGPGWIARFGGADCDVVIEHRSGEARRVEVKATGEHAFQELKDKDLRADVLVWIRFGARFRTGQGHIQVAILRRPGLHIPTARRLDTRRFVAAVGATDDLTTLTFETLAQLLGRTNPEVMK
jgi:hypothetical protein